MSRLLVLCLGQAAAIEPVPIPNDCSHPDSDMHKCSCFELLNLQRLLDLGHKVDKPDVLGGVNFGLQLYSLERLSLAPERLGSIARASRAQHALERCRDNLLDPYWRKVYWQRVHHNNLATRRDHVTNLTREETESLLLHKDWRLKDDFGGPASGSFFQEKKSDTAVKHVIFLDAAGTIGIKKYKRNLANYVLQSVVTTMQRFPPSVFLVQGETSPVLTDLPEDMPTRIEAQWEQHPATNHFGSLVRDRMKQDFTSNATHEVFVLTGGCDYTVTDDGALEDIPTDLWRDLKDIDVRVNVLVLGEAGDQPFVVLPRMNNSLRVDFDCPEWWRKVARETGGYYEYVNELPEDPAFIPNVAPMQRFINYMITSHAYRESL